MIRDMLPKIGWTNHILFNPDSPQASNIELSGKLMALRELLQECQIGDQEERLHDTGSDSPTGAELPNLSQHRALIFCQWRASVDLVAHHLDSQKLGAGIRYLRLDGTVPPDQRQSIVDRFNSDPSVDLLLVTTHIGGVGLTLTGRGKSPSAVSIYSSQELILSFSLITTGIRLKICKPLIVLTVWAKQKQLTFID